MRRDREEGAMNRRAFLETTAAAVVAAGTTPAQAAAGARNRRAAGVGRGHLRQGLLHRRAVFLDGSAAARVRL